MSSPSEPKSRIRRAAPKVAVVGCEHWGRHLVRNYHDLGAVADVIERPQDAGLVLMVGHLLQYHPAFLKLEELAHVVEPGRLEYSSRLAQSGQNPARRKRVLELCSA